MKRRIWELDAARGLAIIGMIAIHLVYDLTDLFGILRWEQPRWYLLFKNNYGALFLVISGISVTLGRHCIRRGLTVLLCGLPVTAATVLLWKTGLAGRDILIYFGVLQCLGCCMLLWPLFRRLPVGALVLTGLTLAAAGLYLRTCRIDAGAALIPLGFAPGWFASSDYFPLMPNLGYFLLGAAAGRVLYRDGASRLPDPGTRLTRALCCMGRHALPIYLLHQPILAGVCLLLA